MTATAQVEVGDVGEPLVPRCASRTCRPTCTPIASSCGRAACGSSAPPPSAGALSVQLAFGGAYYGIVDVSELGMRVVPEQIEHADPRRRRHHRGAPPRPHAEPPHRPGSLGFVYGTIIVDSDPATSPDGLAARRHHPQRDGLRGRRGRSLAVRLGDLGAAGGTLRAGRLGDRGRRSSTPASPARPSSAGSRASTSLGDHEAVVTSVAGRAFVTGHHRYVVDERDPLREGFLLR